MALEAVVDRLLLAFGGVDGEHEFLSQPVAFRRARPHVAAFDSGVGGGRSVAVFTALVGEVRRGGHARETTLERFKALRRPADDVAGKAFRIPVTAG